MAISVDNGCCWSSICVTSEWNHAPSTRRILGYDLARFEHPGRARSPLDDGIARRDVAPRVLVTPQRTESFAESAEARGQRLVTAQEHVQSRIGALRLEAHLHAEDAGESVGVGVGRLE